MSKLTALGFLLGIVLGIILLFVFPDILNASSTYTESQMQQLQTTGNLKSGTSSAQAVFILPMLAGIFGAVVGYSVQLTLKKLLPKQGPKL